MSEQKLKPCPFCGSNKLKLVKKENDIKDITHIQLQSVVIIAMHEEELF